MAVMAQWGTKTWEVASRKIMALNGVTASVKLQTSNNADAAGSPATTPRALDLQSLNFDFRVGAAAGVDPLGEYESWMALVGQSAPFYLGGRRFGPEKVKLTSVSLDDTTLNSFGQILDGKISIVLAEDAEEASSKKKSGGKSKPGQNASPGISTQAELGITSSAASVGPSASDKAALKPSNPQLSTK